MAVTPADVLPEGVDALVIGDVPVRKGTVAAFVANAERLAELTPGTDAHLEVAAQMRALVPAMRAVGLFEVFEPKSDEIRQLIADAGLA